MVLGHYDIDLLPAETKNVEIVFNISSHAPSGGEVSSQFTWKLETPAEWKLRPGETWKDAQESVRSKEEIEPSAKRCTAHPPAHPEWRSRGTSAEQRVLVRHHGQMRGQAGNACSRPSSSSA